MTIPHSLGRLPGRAASARFIFDEQGRPAISDSGLETLKWLALVLMTLDHVNKYFWHEQVAWMFAAGRTVMPVFSFVLAYNLARPEVQPGGRAAGAARRAATRLTIFGVIATPMSWALIGPWPLNILFMLASAAWIIQLLQSGRPGAGVLVGVLSGFLVEFWWPAIGATIAAWYFCRSGSHRAALTWLACLWSLTLINGNLWALTSVPLLVAVACCTGRFAIPLPRAKWLFYGYYPLHLGTILLVRSLWTTG